MEKISEQEKDALRAAHLQAKRRIDGKLYVLAGVALKDDEKKLRYLEALKADIQEKGIKCKLEEKTNLVAIYAQD